MNTGQFKKKKLQIYILAGVHSFMMSLEQVVWADTTDIGCGVTFCPNLYVDTLKGAWLVVCDYGEGLVRVFSLFYIIPNLK